MDTAELSRAAADIDEWVAVAVAIAALFVAAMSYLKSNSAARAQVYLEFRKRFAEIKDSIPSWYNSPGLPENVSDEDRRALELYWQNAFDERFVTNKLEPWHLRKLWNRFYKGTVTLALGNGALREIAADLTQQSAEFGDLQEEFRRALNSLCMRAYHEPLCGDRGCERCCTGFFPRRQHTT